MENNRWRYEDGLFQSTKPIDVASLDGSFELWFDIDERFSNLPQPSSKQWTAWNEFCSLEPDVIRQSFVTGLSDLAQRMDRLPDNAKPGFGPTIDPKVMAKEAREAASALKDSDKPMGKQPDLVFKCDSLVIPLQDNAPVNFVVINFQIGIGKCPDRSYGHELEALFCNGCLLFIGENSGLWTRTDWIDDFNRSDFDPDTAVHPYW